MSPGSDALFSFRKKNIEHNARIYAEQPPNEREQILNGSTLLGDDADRNGTKYGFGFAMDTSNRLDAHLLLIAQFGSNLILR